MNEINEEKDKTNEVQDKIYTIGYITEVLTAVQIVCLEIEQDGRLDRKISQLTVKNLSQINLRLNYANENSLLKDD